MQTFKCGLICLMLVLFSKTAHAALDTSCGVDGDCDTGEVCDTDAGSCVCDADNSYTAGPTDTNNCFLAVNLGNACTSTDECQLGDGGVGAVCSTTCVTPVNLGNPCTNDNECVAGDGGAGTVCSTTSSNCVTPKNLGVACSSNDQCIAGDGGAGTVCDSSGDNTCKKDCGEPPVEAGYTATKDGGTLYGETATVVCDTDNGWAGTASSITCDTSGWTAYSGCSQSGGGGGDCGSPSNPTGYTLTASGGTQDGATATVACATGYTGTPSPAAVACSGGSWATPSGCSIDAKNLEENCDIDEQCAAGDGGANAVCDTTCMEGNGASEIRQFSFLILIGSLVIALM